MVGDKEADILAGRNAGCSTVRIRRGETATMAEESVASLFELVPRLAIL
jgi:phosphoglycolate phosphatase-like HAD superfamily hydrolase